MEPNIICLGDIERGKLLLPHLKDIGVNKAHIWIGENDKTIRQNIASNHKIIIEQAKENGLPEVLIFEDDVYFPSKDGFKYFLDNKPDDFDLYLGGIYSGHDKINENNKSINGFYFSGLHCYICHSRFYNTFLSIDTSNEDLDSALGKLTRDGRAKIKVCYPFAAIQRELKSHNTGAIFYHKLFFNEQNTYGFKNATT